MDSLKERCKCLYSFKALEIREPESTVFRVQTLEFHIFVSSSILLVIIGVAKVYILRIRNQGIGSNCNGGFTQIAPVSDYMYCYLGKSKLITFSSRCLVGFLWQLILYQNGYAGCSTSALFVMQWRYVACR